MLYTIFYSWQSDLPNSTNRSFIEKALEQAAKLISEDNTINIDAIVDRDTAGVAGSPDIGTTILNKIDKCDVFVCDISIINSSQGQRPTPNPNVLFELGYALKRLGWERVIMLLNKSFGDVTELPFDLRMKRVLVYSVNEEQENKSQERENLKKRLVSALQTIFSDIKSTNINSTIFTAPKEDLEWLNFHKTEALKNLKEAELTGYIEACITLHPSTINATSQDLLTAANNSQIATYGWPIGVMDLNTKELKPKPIKRGIQLHFIKKHKHFDYWALRENGTFYLLMSFIEDSNRENQIIKTTRIFKTVEILLYLSNLYKNLNVAQNTNINLKLSHAQFKGRIAIHNWNGINLRHYGPAHDDEIETPAAIPLGDIKQNISLYAQTLLSPFFALFDYFQPPQSDYDQLANDFINGKLDRE